MIITNIKGGLGNQMFQYATGLALSKRKNTEHKLDLSHFDLYKDPNNKETKRRFELDVFNTHFSIATEEEIEKVKYQYGLISKPIALANFYLQVFDFIKYPITLNPNTKDIYLEGHYPSEDFFKDYEEDIRKEFTLKAETKEFKDFCSIIAKDGRRSVSVHIRRGDYVTNANANKHHGVLDVDYYESSWDLLKQQVGELKPYVFTEFKEDIDWVKENMPFIGNDAIYMKNYEFTGPESMILMSKCHNNIVANSSFSWWGAWLNSNKGKIVIAPKSWLKNGDGRNKRIVPESWIRV